MLRVASVGLGWWSDQLADAIHDKSERIGITACTSRSAEKRAAFAEKYGARAIDSFEAVLADPDIDAVLLTTPHSKHAAHVRMAAEAGKHVFVEKPFTLSLDDARVAIAACDSAGVVLAVGHNRRLAPAVAALKAMIGRGDFGTLLHGEAQFSLPSALDYTPERWRADPDESPAGAMTALGIHMVDALTHLFGPVSRVLAISRRHAVAVDIDDTTVMLLDFQSGATAYLGTLFATADTRLLNVYGSKLAAYVSEDLTEMRVRQGTGPITPLELPQRDTLNAELEAFADACAGRAPFPVKPQEAAHNVAVLEAIVQSAASNGAPADVAAV